MAEGPSLRTQVSNLRSKADLEAVFEHADGFPLIDQDDRAFIPELKRAEAALFPADAPLTLKSLELVTRLDMVGRAVSQLSRDGFLPTKRFINFGAAVAALDEAVRERHDVEPKYLSAVTPGAYPEEVPVVEEDRMSRKQQTRLLREVAPLALPKSCREVYVRQDSRAALRAAEVVNSCPSSRPSTTFQWQLFVSWSISRYIEN